MKKNYNNIVSLSKYWNFIVENKIIIWAIIIFMLTFRFSCEKKNGEFQYNFGCSPIRISDVKDIIK